MLKREITMKWGDNIKIKSSIKEMRQYNYLRQRMSESRSTLHGFGKALEKWKSFTPLREEGSSNNGSKIK